MNISAPKIGALEMDREKRMEYFLKSWSNDFYFQLLMETIFIYKPGRWNVEERKNTRTVGPNEQN
jgi:hypothetical protein